MPRLNRVDDLLDIPEELPVIALRDLVFFPYMVLPLLIGRPRSTAALDEAAAQHDGLVVLVTQRDAAVEEPNTGDLFSVGTVARAVQVTPLQDGTARVVLEGLGRVRLTEFVEGDLVFRAKLEAHAERERDPEEGPSTELEALARKVGRLYEDYARLHERIPDEVITTLADTRDRIRLAHLMSGHLLIVPGEKQELLEAETADAYFNLLREVLVRELEILRIEEKLDQQIRLQMEADRRQHYLGEQLRAIQEELGDSGEDWEELGKAIHDADLPIHAAERADREIHRLRKLNPVAPEAAVIRTYLDWIQGLPWTERTDDNLDVAHAADLLEKAHYGLTEVKERILDHIAVLSLVGELQGPILCLVGPPGVGKTSLGRSIAQALDRKFARVSLGGIRDEAEIRGHRRTYVGALPGRVLQGIRRAGTRNPVFLLDEVDKMARDFHGDPAAALLEVLDPEQNVTFTDHYLELEFDLSDVLFVATANTLQGIPDALRDRMEVIRLPGYLGTEKREIARRFIWPNQAGRHGLLAEAVILTDQAVEAVIERYTREAGVRELERRLSRIARKIAREVAEGMETESGLEPGTAARTIDDADLKSLLGPPLYLPPDREDALDRAGIANGLAWTASGGEILDVEVAVVPGSGEVRLTGTLGEVMKESAMAAVTYARSRAARLGLDPKFHEQIDVHIHIPEGATPKDGPSAGITIAVALISALTGAPTRYDVALTGEITLRGRVLPVGGLKEKAVAALRHGITTVLIPAANQPELEELPDEVREGIEFRVVRTMDEVLDAAIVDLPSPARPTVSTEVGVQLSQ